jgi:LuxR family quorum sensing-dependent transcriptional regulator
MLLGDILLTFVMRAARANARKTLVKDFEDFLKPLGGERFICTYLRRSGHDITIQRSIGNLPQAFQEAYLERGFEAYDPVFHMVVRTGGYGYWSDLLRRTALSAKQQEVMDHASEWGMPKGFTRRVMLDHGGMAVVMVSGKHLMESPEASAVLRLACEVFAAEGMPMLNSNTLLTEAELPPAKLSRTQLQVLSLRASGLSNLDVAGQLSIAPKTVESHVTAVKKKLKARNMIDAIQIAQRMRLIRT